MSPEGSSAGWPGADPPRPDAGAGDAAGAPGTAGACAASARTVRAGGDPTAHPASADPRRRRMHALRCAVAVAVAGAVATGAGIGHPYWAMVAALAPLTVAGTTHQVARGVQRAAGTLAGLPLAALLIWLDPPLPVILAFVVVAQGAIELVVTRNYGLALVLITPLALTLGHLANPEPVGALLWDRLVETVIGVVIGMVLAILTRPGAPGMTRGGPASNESRPR